MKLFLFILLSILLSSCYKADLVGPTKGTRPVPIYPIDPVKCWQCKVYEYTPLHIEEQDTLWCGQIEVVTVCDKNSTSIKLFQDSMFVIQQSYRRNVECN